MSAPRQLTLDWPHAPSFAREDFLVADSNRDALQAIERWRDWPGRMLLIVGPSGAGKSHLGAIWAEAAGAVRLDGADLGAAGPSASDAEALLIDDADRVGAAEAELFHILNAVRQRGATLLVAARAAPDAWGLTTPDLLSRLRLAPLVMLGPPDQELTEAVLFKLFSDRQLQVEPQVVSYLALRIDRSLGAARAVVDALDREALARGRRVTRVMASELLRMLPGIAEAP